MNINRFFAHHKISDNPFAAEEAGLDPVFNKLISKPPIHPDFHKILGPLDTPSTSIVFGEKGSGKTAIRLQIEEQIQEHNAAQTSGRVLAVTYDDLNPLLDNLLRRRRQNAKAVLENFRLEDHQDAILSLAVTQLVNNLTHDKSVPTNPDQKKKRNLRKRLSRQQRADLAVLAALYDQPVTGSSLVRWTKLAGSLRVTRLIRSSAMLVLAIVMTLVALGFWGTFQFMEEPPIWVLPALGISLAGAISLWGWLVFTQFTSWNLSRKVRREMPAINHTGSELRQMLLSLSPSDLQHQPFPLPSPDDGNLSDARYQLTRRLINIIRQLDYAGMMVLLDRLDEPTLVSGDADKMQAILRPMLDNKFLKQDHVGIKLLLPLELHYAIRRESAEFFQRARLDKQSMIERLNWSGSTLYDLCNTRLKLCMTSDSADAESKETSLIDLFAEDVSREMIIDALDQMHQPRDAFKFIYAVIQEHCRLVSDEDQNFRIAKLTLDTIRRAQAQRVQEFSRGLAPG
ncbi:hypothetical protein [Poriferisphaera sp. WC338]|uniref:hypothetical protein n=1 Tax=Poriferisphaera sp. WC338 TaxID=3425129 RepID=UPI003D812C91